MDNPIKEYCKKRYRKKYEKEIAEIRKDPRFQDAVNQFLYNDGQNPNKS